MLIKADDQVITTIFEVCSQNFFGVFDSILHCLSYSWEYMDIAYIEYFLDYLRYMGSVINTNKGRSIFVAAVSHG